MFWKGRRNKVVREGDVCMMAVHDRSYLLFCFILVGVAVHVCMYTFASFDTLTHCTFHVCLVCLLVCSIIDFKEHKQTMTKHFLGILYHGISWEIYPAKKVIGTMIS